MTEFKQCEQFTGKINESIQISRKYYYCPRHRHASSETDMPHRRTTCPIGDRHAPSETNIPDRSPTCPFGDWHACKDPSNTNMPAESNRNLNAYIFNWYFCLFIYMSISDGSPMNHIDVSDQACLSPIIIFSWTRLLSVQFVGILLERTLNQWGFGFCILFLFLTVFWFSFRFVRLLFFISCLFLYALF